MSRKKHPLATKVKYYYEEHYKKLLLIPMILLVLSLGQIGYQFATTGTIFHQDVSLKGGVTLSVQAEDFDLDAIRNALDDESYDYDIREISSGGQISGFIIQADIAVDDTGTINDLQDKVGNVLGMELDDENSSTETVGATLGSQFFFSTIKAILMAFIFMGAVVFFYFRTLAPSFAVILAAFSDIVVSLAIINLFGVKIGTGGIAAFLMMIGYSVDTDILLSVRVLKNREGSTMDKVYSALKTGLTMNITTLVAVSIAYLFSGAAVIQQIMLILFVGLLVDMINTWIQNVGILRWHLERKPLKR
ncbi:MAG: protein translocase subunit SecF [Candidatus Woesearchaeota archaeon]